MTKRWTTGITAALGTIALVAIAGCGTATNAPTSNSTPAAANKLNIAISEMKVDVSPTFAAGKYTFTITNTGTLPHELLAFKSDLAQANFPTDSTGDVVEDGPGITKTSDGDNIDPGKSQTREIDLKPGTYLFTCNLAGHYHGGMHTVVTVT
jgi:uncharacterized cupredoxin-like copper-binding protein